MLVTLKSMPAENDDANFRIIDEDELAQGIAAQRAQARAGASNCPGNASAEQLNRFHRNLKPSRGVHLASLHEDSYEETIDKDPKKLLDNIGKEQEFGVTYVDVEEKSKDNKFHCFVQLSTTPVAVCYGIGETVEEARVACAKHALSYLRVMTKP